MRALCVFINVAALKLTLASFNELAQEAPRVTPVLQPGFTQALPSPGARW